MEQTTTSTSTAPEPLPGAKVGLWHHVRMITVPALASFLSFALAAGMLYAKQEWFLAGLTTTALVVLVFSFVNVNHLFWTALLKKHEAYGEVIWLKGELDEAKSLLKLRDETGR